MKLHSINLLFIALLCVQSAKSMQASKEKNQDSLWYACQEIVCSPTWSELLTASLHCKSVETQRLESIKSMLDAGASPNTITTTNVKKGKTIGLTPFHWAVTNNSPRLVALLLQHGADVNIAVDNEPNLKPLGIAMKNYAFNNRHGYLAPTQAHGYLLPIRVDGYTVWKRAEVSTEYPKAWKDNIKIGKLLVDHRAMPMNRQECEYGNGIAQGATVFRNPFPICPIGGL